MLDIFFFFFNDTATTEIYTLSLHDALPISRRKRGSSRSPARGTRTARSGSARAAKTRNCISKTTPRSEEHTSELQSRLHLVCRLLLEKKKINFLKTLIRPSRNNEPNHHHRH